MYIITFFYPHIPVSFTPGFLLSFFNQFGSYYRMHVFITLANFNLILFFYLHHLQSEQFLDQFVLKVLIQPERRLLSLFDLILFSFFFSFMASLFSACLRRANRRYEMHVPLLLCANVVTLWSLLEAPGNIRPQNKCAKVDQKLLAWGCIQS